MLMNPGQPLPTPTPMQTPPPPAAYLDQIAAPGPQKTIPPRLLWIGIGALLLIVIVGFFVIINSGGKSQSQKMTEFVYRVQALEKLTDTSRSTIQSSQLQALNASLNTILTGIDQQSGDSLAIYGISKLPTVPKTAPVTVEYSDLATKLQDAKLNVIFDRTYAREITYQLSIMQSEMKAIYDHSNSKTIKSYLVKSSDNITPLQKEFANFNDSET